MGKLTNKESTLLHMSSWQQSILFTTLVACSAVQAASLSPTAQTARTVADLRWMLQNSTASTIYVSGVGDWVKVGLIALASPQEGRMGLVHLTELFCLAVACGHPAAGFASYFL